MGSLKTAERKSPPRNKFSVTPISGWLGFICPSIPPLHRALSCHKDNRYETGILCCKTERPSPHRRKNWQHQAYNFRTALPETEISLMPKVKLLCWFKQISVRGYENFSIIYREKLGFLFSPSSFHRFSIINTQGNTPSNSSISQWKKKQNKDQKRGTDNSFPGWGDKLTKSQNKVQRPTCLSDSPFQPLCPHVNHISEVSRGSNSSILLKTALIFRTNVRSWDKPRLSVIPSPCKSLGSPILSVQSHFQWVLSSFQRSQQCPLDAGLQHFTSHVKKLDFQMVLAAMKGH